eukprot:1241985-Rhodomonas_salina.1
MRLAAAHSPSVAPFPSLILYPRSPTLDPPQSPTLNPQPRPALNPQPATLNPRWNQGVPGRADAAGSRAVLVPRPRDGRDDRRRVEDGGHTRSHPSTPFLLSTLHETRNTKHENLADAASVFTRSWECGWSRAASTPSTAFSEATNASRCHALLVSHRLWP